LTPPLFRIKSPTGATLYNYKVNRYPNKQNPGTLWYHDHAMRLTTFNAQHGLAGFYILRDTNVSKYLGIDRSNEKFVLISSSGDQKFDLNGLQSGVVYRFRFLNANYAGRATTLRYYFSYNGCLKNSAEVVGFTMIGADSSLFDKGIENRTHFVISNGERIDLLIKFSTEKESFSICGDSDINTLSLPSIQARLATL
jgi:FtsP/CotA-like multicopper oxidase with cupredoxin domain